MTSQTPDGSDDTDLPQILSAWRKRRGITMETAAVELGVSAATWGHWENARRFPNARNLSLLSDYTGLSIRELLCGHYAACPFRRERPAMGHAGRGDRTAPRAPSPDCK